MDSSHPLIRPPILQSISGLMKEVAFPEGDSLIHVVFYCLIASKMWPFKRGSLIILNNQTCIKRLPLKQTKKWSDKTGNLLKEVHFIRNFL